MRYGDITIIYPDGKIGIIENKSGKASHNNRRATRQKRSLEELSNFLKTGTRISKDNTRDYLFEVDVRFETHHSIVAELLEEARRNGNATRIISEFVVVEVVYLEHPNALPSIKKPFDDTENIISISNLDLGIFDKPVTRIAPYGIFPFDERTCFDLLTGYLRLTTTINLDAFAHLFSQNSLLLEIPKPSKEEVARYFTATPAEIATIQKNERSGWLAVSNGKYTARISPDNLARMAMELIHENTFVETEKYLLNQIEEKNITEDEVARCYIGYKGESNIWR